MVEETKLYRVKFIDVHTKQRFCIYVAAQELGRVLKVCLVDLNMDKKEAHSEQIKNDLPWFNV